MASGKVNATSLNLRSVPDTGATSAAILIMGATVTILSTNDDSSWFLVSTPVDGTDRIGWVQAQFIDLDKGTAVVEKPAKVPDDVAALPAADPVKFAELAVTGGQPFWPVVTADPQALVVSYLTTAGKPVGRDSRRFLADRSNGARHHVGIDLFCQEEDDVVACAAGTIVSFLPFLNSGGEETFQLIVEHDGVVINYGEVAENSPSIFGWKRGDKVKAGQRIGRIGATKMLHFETYVLGTKVNQRWMVGEQRPPALLNPTMLLLRLAAAGQRIGVGVA